MIKSLKYIPFIFCMLLSLMGSAQSFHLNLVSVDSGSIEQKSFPNKVEIWQYLHKKQLALQEKGFLACSVDSIQEKDSVVRVRFFQGMIYEWAKVDFSGVPVALWNQLGVYENQWKHVPVSPAKLAGLQEKILTYCDNNGYPFATVFLDSFRSDGNGLTAKFNLITGTPQRIDSIIIEGNSGIALSYLGNYLGIHEGDLYNESLLRKIHKRLQDLSFLEEEKPWKIDFSINKNKLYLYLKHKSANQINGLIGLQPSTIQTGKFSLTADFLLSLQNSLGYGETIEASYKNLQPLSPQFNVHVVAPYIFGTLFGLEGNFTLYKQDTTYRQVTVEGGIRYQFNAENYAKVFYQNIGNRLITPDTHAIRVNRQLPDNIDYQNHGVGATFEMNHTDYQLNPKRGAMINLTASGLVRKVVENSAILALGDATGFDYQPLYDKANQDKLQYKINGFAAWYFPVYRTIVGKINYQGGYIHGQNLFQNELFQIGGFHSFRGFDENSFYASQYHILTAEIHFIFGQNNYFYLFSDNGYVQTRFSGFNQKQIPYSFGAGLNLANKTGIFSLALGLGKRDGEPLSLKNAKIHFGYAAYF